MRSTSVKCNDFPCGACNESSFPTKFSILGGEVLLQTSPLTQCKGFISIFCLQQNRKIWVETLTSAYLRKQIGEN